VEIWFARIERDVIARGIFTSVKDLARKLMRYIRACSKDARPFLWKYSDLKKESSHAKETHCDRPLVSGHELTAPEVPWKSLLHVDDARATRPSLRLPLQSSQRLYR
jgi:hypothetical protein